MTVLPMRVLSGGGAGTYLLFIIFWNNVFLFQRIAPFFWTILTVDLLLTTAGLAQFILTPILASTRTPTIIFNELVMIFI